MQVSKVAKEEPSERFDLFEELYRRHIGFVWSCLRGLGIPEEQLEDVAHEVFIVVYRKFDCIREECSVQTWIYGILRRVASNVRRSNRRAVRKIGALEVATTIQAPSSFHLDLECGIERREASRLVGAYLSTLDKTSREIFILFELHGASGSEISELLGINKNTVHSKRRRLRKDLMRFVRCSAGRAQSTRMAKPHHA